MATSYREAERHPGSFFSHNYDSLLPPIIHLGNVTKYVLHLLASTSAKIKGILITSNNAVQIGSALGRSP